jgi:hypothetical protein
MRLVGLGPTIDHLNIGLELFLSMVKMALWTAQLLILLGLIETQLLLLLLLFLLCNCYD